MRLADLPGNIRNNMEEVNKIQVALWYCLSSGGTVRETGGRNLCII